MKGLFAVWARLFKELNDVQEEPCGIGLLLVVDGVSHGSLFLDVDTRKVAFAIGITILKTAVVSSDSSQPTRNLLTPALET